MTAPPGPFDPFRLVRLDALTALSRGRADVRVGLVDGPVEASHPALLGARIEVRADRGGGARCVSSASVGCRHGTFVASLLVGNGALGIHGICPDVTLVSAPIFGETDAAPTARPARVADAIDWLADSGVNVINLSIGIAAPAQREQPDVQRACARAEARGIVIVAAAGNQARVGPVGLFGHEWVIPVAACRADGRIDLRSNLGPSIGRRGLAAPGENVRGASAPAGAGFSGGSSVAAAFATGACALLRSLHPAVSSARLREALLLAPRRSRSIVPPLLDCALSLAALRRTG